MGIEKKHACPLPFNHMAIRPDGRIFPCCIYRWDDVPEDLNIFHPDPFNHPYMQNLRNKMENDEPVDGCSYCYQNERLSNRSMRKEMWETTNMHGTTSFENNEPAELRYIDLSISNTCNNKCRMCGPALSTQWYSDAKKLGRKIPKGILHNPFIENGDFSKLKYLKILGGEPFLEQDTLKHILSQCNLPELRIIINTNTTIIPDKELHNMLSQCKKAAISLSIDSTGQLNEFLRKGSEWKNTLDTMEWFLKQSNYNLFVHSVASIYNFNQLDKLIDLCLEKNIPHKYVMVDGVDWMLPRHLPGAVKQKFKTRLIEQSKLYPNQAIYTKILQEVDTPGDIEKFLYNDKRLNNIRNETWKDANPELFELIEEYYD